MKLCAAKTRAGGRCKQPALLSGRCRFHGGKSLKGIASPTFKTGVRSRYMPRNLGARFREAMNDPALLKLDQDVAVVEAQLLELLRKFEEPGPEWEQAARLFAETDAAIISGDGATANARRAELKDLLTKGCGQSELRRGVLELIEQRRRLIDSIRKHEVQSAEIITLTEAQVLFSGMAHLVREHVKDKQALRAIAEGFAKLTQGPVALPEPEAGGDPGEE